MLALKAVQSFTLGHPTSPGLYLHVAVSFWLDAGRANDGCIVNAAIIARIETVREYILTGDSGCPCDGLNKLRTGWDLN
jgi:hypothetical protein